MMPMSFSSSDIIPLQFAKGSEFDFRWKFNLDNVAKKYVCVSLTRKKK